MNISPINIPGYDYVATVDSYLSAILLVESIMDSEAYDGFHIKKNKDKTTNEEKYIVHMRPK